VPKFESDASTLVKLYSANWAKGGVLQRSLSTDMKMLELKDIKKSNIKKINIALFIRYILRTAGSCCAAA